jgi:CRISPR/Cas system-associated protein Csx1
MKDMEELRNDYVDALLDRVTGVRYPSGELLDRAINIVHTHEQAERLVEYLIDCIEASKYPSHQLMDRLERILFPYPGR